MGGSTVMLISAPDRLAQLPYRDGGIATAAAAAVPPPPTGTAPERS
jgi:hypothetical protein